MKALRQMPPVHDVLGHPALSHLGRVLERPFVSRLLNEVLDEARERLRAETVEPERKELTRSIAVDLAGRIEAFLRPSLRRVVNASGVILHTNLGRAPLPSQAMDHLKEITAGYSNLEFDLERGDRGARDHRIVRLVNELLGSDDALVVNNNAAAVLLVLNSLADGGEVVASRGEAVEIGGSFRIPDVMVRSGARLREVGTTNRTRIDDYRQASGPETRLLLRVHPSNFQVTGFTERPSLREFVELGRSLGIPTLEDVGSGCLSPEVPAIRREPVPQDSIRAGVDLVCFSGDKLMGGPQAGIVAGRTVYIERMRRNPLFRVLRVGKLTLAVLETVLLMHLKGETFQIPVHRMLALREEELRQRSEALAERLQGTGATPTPLKSVVGGGSVPAVEMPSWGLVLSPKTIPVSELERRFRTAEPPVLVRIEDDRVLLDLRTVSCDDEDELLRVIGEVATP